MKARYIFFGHILRREKDIPAYKAMHFYFDKSPTEQKKNFRGRERITLPTAWLEI